MRAHQQAGRSASGLATTGGIQRSPGKQTLVEASYPASAALSAVPAHEVIQRQEEPNAGGDRGEMCLDPDAVRADLEGIGDEIEDVRRAVDPDGAGASSVARPPDYTNQLRALSRKLENLRSGAEGCRDQMADASVWTLYQRTRDALLAAFQTLALYHADQTLQAWSSLGDEDKDRVDQRGDYYEESGWDDQSTEDWCGMFLNAQYRAAGFHGALNLAFNSTYRAEQFFSYGPDNLPKLILPHGAGKPLDVQAYHRQRGSSRKWHTNAAIGNDINPGDVVALNWPDSGTASDHVGIVRSYTPASDVKPGELITIDGNSYGVRKPGAANPTWDNLRPEELTKDDDVEAESNDVSTSRYVTGPSTGGAPIAGDAGYRDMTVYGRGRPSLVDFEPDHVYYENASDAQQQKSAPDVGAPQGPVQRSEVGAVATADPAGAFDAATRGAAGEIPYRDEMQRSFRADFSSVRSYTGRDLTALGARAATRGDQVAFASSTPDRETVAHELTHVLQARAGKVGSAPVSDPGDASEHEARAAAAEIAAGQPVTAAAGGAAPGAEIQRHKDEGRTPTPLPLLQPAPGAGRSNRLDWDSYFGIDMLLIPGGTNKIRAVYNRAMLRHLPVQLPEICGDYPIPDLDRGGPDAEAAWSASVTELLELVKQEMLDEQDPDVAEDIRVRLFTANQYAMVDALQVETTGRYEKFIDPKTEEEVTFCNVYAYDMVTAMGGYLPRVWWTDAAIARLRGGASAESESENTRELRADGLMLWMRTWGEAYGWQELESAQAAQDTANHGEIVIILGRDGTVEDANAGHVSVVLAESAQDAKSNPDETQHYAPSADVPLQSQAGRENFPYGDTDTSGAGSEAWWTKDDYEDAGFFVYRGILDDGTNAIQTPELLGTERPARAGEQDSTGE